MMPGLRKPVFVGCCAALAVALCAGAMVWLWKSPGPGKPSIHQQPAASASKAPDSSGQQSLSGNTTPVSPLVSEQKKPAASMAVQRLERVRQLCRQPDALDREAIEMLCAFLMEVPDVEGMSGGEEAELKNAIMNKLGRQADPARFEAVLLKVEADAARQPEVIRDYALQHLCAWYDRLPDQAAARQVFWRRAAEGQGSSAGTAFLALRRLESMRQLSPEDQGRLRETARAVVVASDASESARMAALEVLRGAGDPAALPAARALIGQNPSSAAAIAALGAIGELGDAGDARWLKNQLAVADDAALRPALARALGRLEKLENGKGVHEPN